MNKIDFTNPAGFPLEADATLGFLQDSLKGGINGLATYFGSELSFIILSGCEDDGINVSSGWILVNGEVYRFEGGVKSQFVVLDESVVAKANQNGQIYDRYFTRVWRFGTVLNPSANFPYNQVDWGQFVKLNSIFDIVRGISTSAGKRVVGSNINWVVLDGCEVVSISGNEQMSAGTVVFGDKIIRVLPYVGVGSENSPLYLSSQGEWNTTGSGLKFTPDTSRRIAYLNRKKAAESGAILWQVTSGLDAAMFDVTGLGKVVWEGFAKANGQNGTTNLSNAIAGLTAIQRI